MNHDPLCSLTKPCVDKYSGRIETHAMCECHVVCMHCEVATCQCSVVKQARADERERIIATHKPDESTAVAVLDGRGEFAPATDDQAVTSCAICNSQYPCNTVVALRLHDLIRVEASDV